MLRVTLCRLPHNKILGIQESAYPLWAGYLAASIEDLDKQGQIKLSFLDGENIDYGADGWLYNNRLINRAATAFFPRFVTKFSNLKDFASNPGHPGWPIFIKQVLETAPDVIATSCYTNQIATLNLFAKHIKKVNPNIIILVGGIHATVEFESLTRSIPEIDYCCVGEGEVTLRQFLLARLADQSLDEVPGIYNWRAPQRFKPRDLVNNVDEIPPPNRVLADPGLYRQEFHIFSSRGCPFRCSFCSSHRLWSRRVRYHSVERIIAEISYIVDKLGGYRIIFVDDTFTLSRRRVVALAQALKEKGYDQLNIHVGARIDTLDKELIDLLVGVGVRSMSMGIETGSQRVQKLIHKNLTLQQIYDIMGYAKEAGITTLSYYMVGHPTETSQEVDESIKLIKQLGASKVSICAVQPLPGTDYYDIAVKKGFHLDFESALAMDQLGFPICNMTTMSDHELKDKTKKIYQVANRLSQIGRIKQAVDYYSGRILKKLNA
jgi:anaerobic magnesium-protoporphyrin IX monomethyl ester cyclase